MFNGDGLLLNGYIPGHPGKGFKDIWNSKWFSGADFSPHDIPMCPTYLPNGLPKTLISFPRAKTLFNSEMRSGHVGFHNDAFVHYYCYDHLFDGPQNSIWHHPDNAMSILRHFGGVITPDFSPYADFPDPLKRYNTYRMRGFGLCCISEGLPVINNVRWGTEETWEYCFDGIEKNSVVCIGNVASGINKKENREYYMNGFLKMLEILTPKAILFYGAINGEIIGLLKTRDIELIHFPSETDDAFSHGKGGKAK